MEHVSHFNPAGLVSQSREDVRDSLFLAGILRESGGEEHQARVRNLSAGGMMAECDAEFASGDVVSVILRGIGTVTGKVAWKKGERLGIAFDREIDPIAARKPVGQGASTPPSYATPIASGRPGLRTE